MNKDENDFITKNMSMEFNDNLIKFLFEFLLKKTNDFYILSNICFMLNKLSFLLKKMKIHFFSASYKNILMIF